MVAKHITFLGHVQGVGFRYAAQRIASRYGLTGFVRNLPDGTVEMLAQGRADTIDHCLAEIGDEMPGHIHEHRIDPVPFNPRYIDFRIAF